MASIEERVTRLEGNILPFQTMKRELYDDYLSLKVQIAKGDEELQKARIAEVNAHKALKDAREEYEHAEAAMLATADIGGRNADERKTNTADALAKAKSKGGGLYDLWQTFRDREYEYELAVENKQSAIDHFSAVRYVARMTAALANALGG